MCPAVCSKFTKVIWQSLLSCAFPDQQAVKETLVFNFFYSLWGNNGEAAVEFKWNLLSETVAKTIEKKKKQF